MTWDADQIFNSKKARHTSPHRCFLDCPYESCYSNSFENQESDLQKSCTDLTRMGGYQDNSSSYVYQVTCPILLTHLPLVPHIYASVHWAGIGSDNGLSPVRHQAITWTNADFWSIGHLGTNFNEIRIEIWNFYSWKCIWKCLMWNGAILSGGDELTHWGQVTDKSISKPGHHWFR